MKSSKTAKKRVLLNASDSDDEPNVNQKRLIQAAKAGKKYYEHGIIVKNLKNEDAQTNGSASQSVPVQLKPSSFAETFTEYLFYD